MNQMLPETWVARDLVARNWRDVVGMAPDLQVLHLGDNGCVWLVGDPPLCILKAAAVTELNKNPLLYETWAKLYKATGLVPEPFAMSIEDGFHLSDGAGWVWTLRSYVAADGDRQYEPMEAGRSLGAIHRALGRMDGLRTESAYNNLSPEERAKVNDWLIVNERLDGDFYQDVKEALGLLAGWYAETITTMREVKYALSRQVVHRDFHGGNLVLSDGRVKAVDVDLVSDLRVIAVGFAAMRSGDEEAFLDGYCSQDNMTDAERRLCLRFGRIEAVRRLNWILRTNCVEGRNVWRNDLRKMMGLL